MKLRILFAALLSAIIGKAQLPEQDCINAINLCQPVYTQSELYSGSGHITNEVNNNLSCLGAGELNSIWFKVVIYSDGDLNFTITPADQSDDIDWAVFNLTNSQCSQNIL